MNLIKHNLGYRKALKMPAYCIVSCNPATMAFFQGVPDKMLMMGMNMPRKGLGLKCRRKHELLF